jgi:arylsulfatase A-like enzyme
MRMVAAYSRGPDIAQHAAFRYAPWADAAAVDADTRRAFRDVVPEAYRAADALVGSVFERMGTDDTLLAISDHGFGLEKEPGTANPYSHILTEPPGVLFAYGPEIEAGAHPRRACIYDVAPTVLRLCGFPRAEDMEGRCLEEILTDRFRRDHPDADPVATYGLRSADRAPVATSVAAEKDMHEHLRALGYLD